MYTLYINDELHFCESKEHALDVLLREQENVDCFDGAITPERLTALYDLDCAFSDCAYDAQYDMLYEWLSEFVDIESIAREHVLAEREAVARNDHCHETDDPTYSDDYHYEVYDAVHEVVDVEVWAATLPSLIEDVEEQLVEICTERIRDLWSAGYGDIEFEGNRIDREAADEAFGSNDEEDNDNGLDELFG